MKRIVFLIIAFWNTQNAMAQQKGNDKDSIFPKGNKVTENPNFTGTAYVQMLVPNDSLYNVNIGSVTFEPKARTNWHIHQGGQILLVTNGVGYYQERGSPIVVIKKGDTVKCPANIEHWHGASPNKSMTHIAIGTNIHLGGIIWLQPVTDREYKK